MDTAPFVGELITIIGYVMIFLGVYKLFQIGSTLTEIKDLLKSGQRGFAGPSGPSASDPADAYAENLLRSLHQDSEHAEHITVPPTIESR